MKENNGTVDVCLSADEFEHVTSSKDPLVLLLNKAVSEGQYKDEWVPFPKFPCPFSDVIVQYREKVISLDNGVVESLDVILGLMKK